MTPEYPVFRYTGHRPRATERLTSRPDGRNVGDGLNFGYDITDIVLRLALSGRWDRQRVRVTLVPEPSTEPYMATVDAVTLFIQ